MGYFCWAHKFFTRRRLQTISSVGSSFFRLVEIAIGRIPKVNAVFCSIGCYSDFMYYFHFLDLCHLEVVYRNIFLIEASVSPL